MGAGTVRVSFGGDSVDVPISVVAPPDGIVPAGPGDTVLSVNFTELTVNAYGAIPQQLTATTTGTGPITFTSLSPAIVTVDAAGNMATQFADGVATIRVSDGVSTVNVAVTVDQRASYVYVRVPAAVMPNDPRSIYVASLSQSVQLEAIARDFNGNNAFDPTLPNNGWSALAQPDPAQAAPIVFVFANTGPAASAAPGVATAEISTVAAGSALIRMTGKGGSSTISVTQYLEVLIASGLAGAVSSSITIE